MYYVRFLKVPRIIYTRDKKSISAVITLTSDLGDEFYYDDIVLHVELLALCNRHDPGRCEKQCFQKKVQWRNGMHSLTVDVAIDEPGINFPVRLYVGSCAAGGGSFKCNALRPNKQAEESVEDNLPILVNAWSDFLNPQNGQFQAQKQVQRRIVLSSDGTKVLRLWEETGNSISRHIWDAGLLLLVILSRIKEASVEDRRDPESTLILQSYLEAFLGPMSVHYQSDNGGSMRQSHREPPLILELGTGCGIVSLGFSMIYPEAKIHFTDLPDVKDIVHRNKAELLSALSYDPPRGTTPVNVNFESLDWEQPVPQSLQGLSFSLILVADCIYNPDSYAALIATLCGLTIRSQAQILVAWKRRHPSEDKFCDMMLAAGFIVIEQDYFKLSKDDLRDITDGVHICIYRAKIPEGKVS